MAILGCDSRNLAPMWRTVFLPLLLLTSACGRIAGGTFDAVGYRHSSLDYRINNVSGAEQILEPHWMLDNYRDATSLRDAPAYLVHRRFDVNDDGRLEDIGQVPRDDLRYVSSRDAGLIWVRTLPLPRALARTEPSVLLRLLVEGIAGTGLVGATLGDGTATPVLRTHSAVVLDERPIEIDGREGVVATIDVASVEQLQLDPSARTARIRLVLVHTDFLVSVGGEGSRRHGFVSGLLMLGYSNLLPEFERSLADFEGLLTRVRMQRVVSAPFAESAVACAAEDGVAALVVDRRSGVSRPYVVLRPEDEPRRACFERVAADMPNGSFGFRTAESRYVAPVSNPEPPSDSSETAPTDLASAP